MKVGFQHPETGIPCVGEWDRVGSVLEFNIEGIEDVELEYSAEDIATTYEWCMRIAINCDSVNQANNHLDFLGIRARLRG